MTDDYVFDNYITNQSNLINESPYIQVNPPIYIQVYPPQIISVDPPQNIPVNPPQNIPENPPQNIPENQINQEHLRDSLDKGQAPRRIFSQIKKSNEETPFNTDNNPNMINVCFGLSTGQSFNEKASKNMIFKDLCVNFVTRLGFKKEIIENNHILFLYNGRKLDINQRKNLKELGIYNNSKIVVIDLKGLIGA